MSVVELQPTSPFGDQNLWLRKRKVKATVLDTHILNGHSNVEDSDWMSMIGVSFFFQFFMYSK